LVGISIMLNVLTAFFVGSFVTKRDDSSSSSSDDEVATSQAPSAAEPDFHIHTAEKSMRRVASSNLLSSIASEGNQSLSPRKKKSRSFRGRRASDGSTVDHGLDADSETSSMGSEFFEFDVYEREGLDKIMATVARTNVGSDMARRICSYLEIFESMAPGRETLGFMVCDQQTLERFGNKRFQSKASGFLDENELHLVVNDMYAELLALASRATFVGCSLLRTFPSRGESQTTLEVAAALLRSHPALLLFVTRIVPASTENPDQAESATGAVESALPSSNNKAERRRPSISATRPVPYPFPE
jgi:hypothetical protein